MASLIFSQTFDFITAKFQVTQDFSEVSVDMKSVKKKFKKIELQDVSILLLVEEPSEEFGGITFELPIDGHKNGKIEIQELSNENGFAVSMSGKFEIKVREGVKSSVKKNWNLRVAGVSYMGGAYSGFMSYITGQSEGNQKEWLRIDSFEIK